MADDVTLPATGAIIAADEVAGKKYQRMKIAHGPDGSATDTSEEAPFPVAVVGGATAAKQTELAALIGEVQATPTANTLLGRIRALALQLPASLGIKTATASLSVTVASDDALLAGLGAKADSSATTDTGTFSLLAFVKRGQEKLTSIAGGIVNIITALGAIGDAAWASGNGSVIALLKTIATASADVSTPLPTFGLSLRPTNTFNRPADTTAYAIGDLIANNTTAGSVTAPTFAVAASAGGKGLIRSVKIDKAGATAATIRAHFWLAAPTPANGDNGVFSATKAGYLGYIDVVLAAFSDGAAGIGLGEIPFDLASGTTVACLLEARTAFTPTSASAYGIEVTAWPEA